MSSGCESEHVGGDDATQEMSFIADKVREHPEILEKSQLPAMKIKKNNALSTIVQEYMTFLGKDITNKAFMKKVNNMKTRLKSKTDKNKTGNKRIRLLPWEKTMLEAMNADVNPVLSQVPGAVAIGVSAAPPIAVDANEIETSTTGLSGPSATRKRFCRPAVTAKKEPPKPTITDARPEESDETRHLTMTQLQRLVLIEQLKTARLQQEYFSAKVRKLAETANTETSISYVGDRTYHNLQPY